MTPPASSARIAVAAASAAGDAKSARLPAVSSGRARLALAALTALAAVLSVAPFGLWPLAWVCALPLLLAVAGTSSRAHVLVGWFAGTLYNLGMYHWLAGTLVEFGHLPPPLALAGCAAVAAAQGARLALAMWLLALLGRRWRAGAWLLAPIAYVAAEGVAWNLFPGYFGVTQVGAPAMLQVCELGGVQLLSVFLMATNGALADAVLAWRAGRRAAARRRLALALAVPALVAGYGFVRLGAIDARIAAAPRLNVGVAEADVGGRRKRDPVALADTLLAYQRLSVDLAARGAQLIVWPETAYASSDAHAATARGGAVRAVPILPRDAVRLPPSDAAPAHSAAADIAARVPRQAIGAPQRGFRTPLLFGATTFLGHPLHVVSPAYPGTLFNSAVLLDAHGEVLGIYDKIDLLAFGERTPLASVFPALRRWTHEARDLAAGTSSAPLTLDGIRIGVLICNEDILPAAARRAAAHDPHLLVTLVNDSWYGSGTEPYQHFALAVPRAVEHRLALVRSTNTGISGFVDPAGRIRSVTATTGAEALLAEVPLLQGATAYRTLGDWPLVLSWLAVAAAIARRPAGKLLRRQREYDRG